VDTPGNDRQAAPELSIHRAFVVHFYAGGDRVEAAGCRGRVEHVVTGEGSEFASLEDLLVFVRRMLRLTTI
jgi:hypothetical protein